MKYLLDTCMISYFVKGEPQILKKMKATSPTELCISSITLMEIEFGLLLNQTRAQQIQPVIDSFLENIKVLPFTKGDAICAAAIRAALQKKGTPIGAFDMLLAGCSIHHGLIFVTSNTKEFQRVSGLLIEDWRKA